MRGACRPRGSKAWSWKSAASRKAGRPARPLQGSDGSARVLTGGAGHVSHTKAVTSWNVSNATFRIAENSNSSVPEEGRGLPSSGFGRSGGRSNCSIPGGSERFEGVRTAVTGQLRPEVCLAWKAEPLYVRCLHLGNECRQALAEEHHERERCDEASSRGSSEGTEGFVRASARDART